MRTIFTIIMVMCAIDYAISQRFTNKTDDKLRQEIEAINNRIEQLYLDQNIGSLVSLYAEELTFFPEYKPAIFETKNLTRFFTDWFNTGDIKAYKKKIYAVEIYDRYLLEIGTFKFNYASLRKPQGEYNGNYMILWKRNIGGDLRIVSETFGAEKNIDPRDVPYADVQIPQGSFVGNYSVSKQLQSEIEEFDAVVLEAVAEGDGDARAKGFTEDAILMGNSDTIRIGMEAIRLKMLKTYIPGTSYIVKHSYNRIYDLGDYVFINGHYKGGWGDSTNGGRFEGNMSNFMKRGENGKLLMHRQTGNRESLEVFKQ